ncbi:hypothetical protein MLD38_030898 [Melastoma candidum]|uniref:Uncharacterized protein n=1 Tax=Melastoma candidum TaxID=119954 RepID=A0ACB9MMR5_9MYRT|nr:hypothetical protein MLD38_030898 [Melastoma candidum]
MQVYGFNLVTLASYFAMFVVTVLYLWGTAHRLLGKGEPEISRLEISERAVVETANMIRAWADECIRWMFRVGAEGDWLTFAGAVAALWSTAMIGHYFDLLTLLYICEMATMPLNKAFYIVQLAVRYQEKIKGLKDEVMVRCRRLYETGTRKVVGSKAGVEEKKDKKIE